MVDYRLDGVFCRRFWVLMRVMFPQVWSPTFLLFIFLFVLSVLDQVITYFVGILPSEFYVVLGNRDVNGFHWLVLKALIIVFAKSLALATIKYTTSVLYINWRRLLCQELHVLYFAKNCYYHINTLQDEVDNPDQRITQDVEKTCQYLGGDNGIFWPLIISPFVIAYYTYQTYISSGYFGPLAIYIYFIIGTVINKLLMNPTVALVVEQERREGNFRYKHMAIRSHSEAIGFMRAGSIESFLTRLQLERLLKVQSRLINWQYALQFSMTCFDYIGSVLSYFILGLVIFTLRSYDGVSAVDLTAALSKSSFFYLYLINSFSQVLDKSLQFSDMAGTMHRIGELLLYMRAYTAEPMDSETAESTRPSTLQSFDRQDPDPDISDGQANVMCSAMLVSYSPPASEKLFIRDLNLIIEQGKHVLISGESASGKTSLFRVLAGLWPVHSGTIDLRMSCERDAIMFVPQKPYFPHGSLRQQVVYPHQAVLSRLDPTSDKCIMEILMLLQLEHILQRVGGLDLDADWNWHESLSPGEMQRLAFSRVLYHKPRLVFLDEATSSVGVSVEQIMYEALQRLKITYCSIGHRESLRRYHNCVLRILGSGDWSFCDI